MSIGIILAREVARVVATTAFAFVGPYRSWPPRSVLLEQPLALAEQKTDRLRRIYSMATRDAWDGPTVFREAVAKRGGIQLSREKRVALSHLITMLMYGELGAWIVSAELAEQLEEPDAKLAASAQVFDEARHFYILRDYLALLHVPAPQLDPYFVTAVRVLLNTRKLEIKLAAMQLLAEGTAQTIFHFLADSEIEPVLTEILPYISRDEARHIGLGILYLPGRLAELSPRECRRIALRVNAVGSMFAATQLRLIEHYDTLGVDPRELFRRADRMMWGLSEKLGKVPNTNQRYLDAMNPDGPEYEKNLAYVLPPPGQERTRGGKILFRVLDLGARALA